ncbi:MAG TPA: flagellar hook-basal body complex protein [Roseateles sp.]
MIDSIFIGTSGLQAFSEGLKVIGNNVANLNTPGFKASDSVFANMVFADSQGGSGQPSGEVTQFGSGVMLSQTAVNFRAGELRQTGNPLDVNVSGEGFFVTREKDQPQTLYTRAGQFEFNKDGHLVVRGTERQVIGLSATGEQLPITLDGLRINPPKPTATVTLGGNLSSSATDFSIASVKIIDSAGGEHSLTLKFTPKTGAAGTWTVQLMDGSTEVGNGEIRFTGSQPLPGFDSIDINYSPTGVTASSIKLDFSKNVTNFDTGTTSSLAVSSSDGHAVGTLNKITFDADGTLALGYSNGQTAKGAKVALALFDSTSHLVPQGNSGFTYADRGGVRIGAPNQSGFGSIGSNQVEGSNVDLASEFSDLIVAQRGYQASSRIVSTASELLQDLFDMKGHR